MASAYALLIQTYASRFAEFMFWADKCSWQNKNWTFFSALLLLVNIDAGPRKIAIQYLEKGHTFMRADAVHGLLAQEIKRRGQVDSFADIVHLVQQWKTQHRIDCPF